MESNITETPKDLDPLEGPPSEELEVNATTDSSETSSPNQIETVTEGDQPGDPAGAEATLPLSNGEEEEIQTIEEVPDTIQTADEAFEFVEDRKYTLLKRCHHVMATLMTRLACHRADIDIPEFWNIYTLWIEKSIACIDLARQSRVYEGALRKASEDSMLGKSYQLLKVEFEIENSNVEQELEEERSKIKPLSKHEARRSNNRKADEILHAWFKSSDFHVEKKYANKIFDAVMKYPEIWASVWRCFENSKVIRNNDLPNILMRLGTEV